MAKSNPIVIRPDVIVDARYDVTARQSDIIDMVLNKIKENDDVTEYEINISDYAKYYKTNTSNIYRDLKKAVKEMEGKGFLVKNKDKETETFFVWFTSITYMNREGKIVFELGKKLKDILLEVKRYACYPIEAPLQINSVYSKKLYYKLSLYRDTGWHKTNVDDLRKALNCPESYEKYSHFKKNVLEVAKEEINAETDLLIDYEEIKDKNKVASLLFKIYVKQNVLAHKASVIDSDKILEDYSDCEIFKNFKKEQQENILKIATERLKSSDKSVKGFIKYADVRTRKCEKPESYYSYFKKIIQKDNQYLNEYEDKIEEKGNNKEIVKGIPEEMKKKLGLIGMSMDGTLPKSS